MKRIAILVFLSTMILSVIPLKLSAQEMSKQDYWEKSKKQNSTAWVLLGGGAVLSGIGMIMSASNTGNALGSFASGSSYEGSGINGDAVIIVGGAAMLGSIPLFISSKNNYQKGILLSLQNQPINIPKLTDRNPKPYPTLTLKVPLGKAR